MTGLAPYFMFPGSAREALTFYQSVFGGELMLHSYSDFGRSDGPAEAIAHGILTGPVELFAADAAEGESPTIVQGMLFSLLGTAEPATLQQWFTALTDGATKVDELQQRPWGDYDGTLTDRFGIPWLVGYEQGALGG